MGIHLSSKNGAKRRFGGSLINLVFLLIAIFSLLALVIILDVLLDLRAFEFAPLTSLLGVRGILVVTSMSAFVFLMFVYSAGRVVGRTESWVFKSRFVPYFGAINVVLVLWMSQWVFFEYPPTAMLADAFVSESSEEEVLSNALVVFENDGSLPAFRRANPSFNMDEVAIATILARVSLNRPTVFDEISIGQTIVGYAQKYDVSPILLLHWNYIDSFYGEAPGGPMPFFAEVNGEMFRDLVQAHLPHWFVESELRVALIEGEYLDSVLPSEIALKLRYALQKATYDIAISPYMNSVYSDLFLVLSEYEHEFPELFDGEDPLGESFLALKGSVLKKPYHEPLAAKKVSEGFYDTHRVDLISFGRAAVYRLNADFDFATKSQALVAKYYADEYRKRLGSETWDSLSIRQQTAMLAMLRDVYVPNIGTTSSNLYLVPEFNTTPINFLADVASSSTAEIARDGDIWVPEDKDKLWGATGLMLRVLSEVWLATSGEALRGVNPASTLDDSAKVVARVGISANKSRASENGILPSRSAETGSAL